jgi:hypothetical protein
MPTQVFIIPPRSPREHKQLGVTTSDKTHANNSDAEKPSSQSESHSPVGEQKKCSSDPKLSTIKIHISPPERILDNLFDWDDEDRRFGHRSTPTRRQRQRYKEPPPSSSRIIENVSPPPQHGTFAAIVSAPIVELPAALIQSNAIDYTTTSKRDESTHLDEIHGYTLLHLAAKLGHEDIMRLLINETSQANSLCNSRGQTPLLCAIESGSTSTATLLMEQDPLSLTCKDSIGSSAFHYATEHCNDTVLSRAISLLKRLSSSTVRHTVSFSQS